MEDKVIFERVTFVTLKKSQRRGRVSFVRMFKAALKLLNTRHELNSFCLFKKRIKFLTLL